MKIKPNYVNPTVAEESFHALLHDLNDLGIERDKFLSMFKDLTKAVATQLDDLNLFEMSKLVDQQLRVRVVVDGVRNPYTNNRWSAKNSLKVYYKEAFDAVVIPLKTNKMVTSARLAIAPEAGRMELQVKYGIGPHWTVIETDKHRFVNHFNRIVLGVSNP